MMVAFTNTETNYLLVHLFFDVVLILSYLYLWYRSCFGSVFGLVGNMRTKTAMVSPKSCRATINYVGIENVVSAGQAGLTYQALDNSLFGTF